MSPAGPGSARGQRAGGFGSSRRVRALRGLRCLLPGALQSLHGTPGGDREEQTRGPSAPLLVSTALWYLKALGALVTPAGASLPARKVLGLRLRLLNLAGAVFGLPSLAFHTAKPVGEDALLLVATYFCGVITCGWRDAGMVGEEATRTAGWVLPWSRRP